MDVAGEDKAPARAHVLAAAEKAGLSSNVAGRVLDEMLDRVTPGLLRALVKTLPLTRSTVAMVHRAMSASHARLRKS